MPFGEHDELLRFDEGDHIAGPESGDVEAGVGGQDRIRIRPPPQRGGVGDEDASIVEERDMESEALSEAIEALCLAVCVQQPCNPFTWRPDEYPIVNSIQGAAQLGIWGRRQPCLR
ncbi:MAG: hypothetical protein AAFV53_14480 [Myxococcota bacterium]